MSIVCESFGCTPAEAEEQPPGLVYAILDYRLAQSAKEMLNTQQADKMTEGQANMLKRLSEILRERDG